MSVYNVCETMNEWRSNEIAAAKLRLPSTHTYMCTHAHSQGGILRNEKTESR